MFKLSIDTSNDAFAENGGPALANLLMRIASEVHHGSKEGSIIDDNGNRVGSFTWDNADG